MNDKLKENISKFLNSEYSLQSSQRTFSFEEMERFLKRFAEQNTLTLESKIDENGVVEKPKFSSLEIVSPAFNHAETIDKYNNLPTIKQMPSIIKELREENERLNKNVEYWKQTNSETRDYLQEELNKEYSKLTQAETKLKEKEQRIKELEEFKSLTKSIESIYNLYSLLENESFSVNRWKKLLNK